MPAPFGNIIQITLERCLVILQLKQHFLLLLKLWDSILLLPFLTFNFLLNFGSFICFVVDHSPQLCHFLVSSCYRFFNRTNFIVHILRSTQLLSLFAIKIITLVLESCYHNIISSCPFIHALYFTDLPTLNGSESVFNLKQFFSFSNICLLSVFIFIYFCPQLLGIHFLFLSTHDLQFIHIFKFKWLLEMPIIILRATYILCHIFYVLFSELKLN